MLKFVQVSFQYPSGKGLHDINLCLSAGELVVISGINGSGKTLLSRLTIGLEKPQQGSILWNDHPISQQIRKVRKEIGLIFQEPEKQLLCHTVEDELRFGPQNNGFPDTEIDKTVEELSDEFHLTTLLDTHPSFLSGGERRRIAIASILSSQPQIVIFDEPFLSLDYPSSKSFLHTILRLKQQGRGIVIITHDYERVLAHADRMIILKDGTLIADGDPSETLARCWESGLRPAKQDIALMTWLE